MSAKLIIVNPSERDYTDHRFVLSFGAYGTTHLLVWGNLESALETAADWLAENAPGLIMGHESEELQELFNEAMGELYPDAESIDSLDSEQVEKCQEQATADLTYTESGYLTSYEWFITLENPSRRQLKAFIGELAERHYDDGPVVDITRPNPRIIPSGRYVNVRAHHSDPGKGLSYGAMRVKLVDPCETEGWDVIDVILPDGSEGSVYSFSVER